VTDRDLLMIPGPINFDPAVLRAMSAPAQSHVGAPFVETFGRCLDDLCQVFMSPDGSPFIVAGSGTLAMEMALVNLLEPGDRVLVAMSGVFGERFAEIAKRWGCAVETVRPAIGEAPDPADVDRVLKTGPFKAVCVTHVDTSTGVVVDVRRIAEVARAHGALVVVDGVCAAGGVECRQSEWGIDVYLTASQKAMGTPTGLALLVASPKALAVAKARTHPVPSYYADWGTWLPIMTAYRARKPSYFGTPPTNLIAALSVSLAQMMAEGMPARFQRHTRLSAAFKASVSALGLRQLPVRPELCASTLTAAYYPEGVGPALVGRMAKEGVVVAGGLHPEVRDRYFRVGHMGPVSAGDVLATAGALETSLAALGYRFAAGAGVAAAQAALLTNP
jgi:alanine-glyoxylate transaminase / serine-glyoxylate transaminase / serine-pyruvate transaminase